MTVSLLDTVAPLQGGINFRDLGGKCVAEGRKIHKNRLFRAGSLNRLTEEDCDFLSALPVVQILDYRDSDEVKEQPDKMWVGVDYHHIPANPISSPFSANFDVLNDRHVEQFEARTYMLELYRHLPFGNPAYRQLLNLMQHAETGGIVQHCAVGKDRTGVGAALVLLALGANQTTVMEDYLLTEVTLAPYRDKILTQWSENLNRDSLAKLQYALSAREEFMMAALNAIVERYGSTDRWLELDYGLNRERRIQLQNRYLEE